MQTTKLKNILEAVLLGADRTLTVNHMESLFELDEERPTRDEIRKALLEMAEDYEARGYELKEVASGYRLQVRQEYATWVGRLWEERPARYTRALLETMALIAYRQPITRGEIEEVRGVSVSSNIIKTLLERDWIKVLGHKDVPGKPSLYGTTKTFLDYFNLKSLDQLPTLAEIKDLESIHPELALDDDQNTDVDANKDDGENSDRSVDDDSIDSENSVVDQTESELNEDGQSEDGQNEEESLAEEVAQDVVSSETISEEQIDEGQPSEDQTIKDQMVDDLPNKDEQIKDQNDETDSVVDEEKKVFIV